MPNQLRYTGSADGWTVQEHKDLVDDLAGWHDPANGQRVTRLSWDVDSDEHFVTLISDDVDESDLATAKDGIETLLGSAPNTWDVSDEAFNWG